MAKFKKGEIVLIKDNHPMSGLVGVIVKHSEENHTYFIHIDRNQELWISEENLKLAFKG